MKKTIVLIAALLSCCLAYSQEANSSATQGDLTVIPRLCLDPAFYSGDGAEFSLGESALYTLFEGNLGEKFSFSFQNHWLSTYTADLYTNNFRPYAGNWMDVGYLKFHSGNFFVLGGKDALKVCNFENDEYDFDVHWQLCSQLWSNFNVYQWGGSTGYQNEDETTTIGVQFTASPQTLRPFEGGYSASVFADKEFDSSRLIAAALYVKNWTTIFSAGYQYYFDDLTVSLSGYATTESASSCCGIFSVMKEWDKLDLTAKVGVESMSMGSPLSSYEVPGLWSSDLVTASAAYAMLKVRCTDVYSGLILNWYPLAGSKDLRIHAMGGYNGTEGALLFSIGATYFLNINLF